MATSPKKLGDLGKATGLQPGQRPRATIEPIELDDEGRPADS
jgi:hypothetical protein